MLRDSLCLSVPTYNPWVFWSARCLCGWVGRASPLAGTISLLSDVAPACGWAISNWWLGLKEKTTLGLGGLCSQNTSSITHPHVWLSDPALPPVLRSNCSLQSAYLIPTPQSGHHTSALLPPGAKGKHATEKEDWYQSLIFLSISCSLNSSIISSLPVYMEKHPKALSLILPSDAHAVPISINEGSS